MDMVQDGYNNDNDINRRQIKKEEIDQYDEYDCISSSIYLQDNTMNHEITGKMKQETYLNMDNLEPTRILGIKIENSTNETCESSLERVKDELSTDKGEPCSMIVDYIDHIKQELDPLALDVKVEHEEPEIDMVRTEELYIKPDMSIDGNFDINSERAAEEQFSKKEPGEVHGSTNSASVSSKMRQCKYCVDKTTGMAEYSETRCTCKQNLCRHCNAKFKGKQSLDDHIVKNHKEFIADVSSKIHECKHCSYKTTNVAYLNNTHMAKHLRVGGDVKRLLCRYCNASFRVKKTLDDHILKNHEESIASVSSKIHQCKYCSYKTTFSSLLAKHVMTHSECANRNLCAHCNGKFKSKKALDDHIVKNHREFIASVSSKIHKCKHCSYRTTIASHLVGHMTKHPESECSIEQKLCTHCDAAFKSKKALDDHVVKNHREFIASVSTKIYECEHCSYKTTISSHLVSHLAKHPESGCNVKPNSCRHCGATFKRKTALDDHILKKHKEFIADVSCKIHECRYCSYKTTMAAHLTGHNMTRHSKTVTGD